MANIFFTTRNGVAWDCIMEHIPVVGDYVYDKSMDRTRKVLKIVHFTDNESYTKVYLGKPEPLFLG